MTHTQQYRNFAAQRGMSPKDLAPFWTRARNMADHKFNSDTTEDGYWAYAWATMKGLIDGFTS